MSYVGCLTGKTNNMSAWNTKRMVSKWLPDTMSGHLRAIFGEFAKRKKNNKNHIISGKTSMLHNKMRHVSFSAGVALRRSPGCCARTSTDTGLLFHMWYSQGKHRKGDLSLPEYPQSKKLWLIQNICQIYSSTLQDLETEIPEGAVVESSCFTVTVVTFTKVSA